jgi:hypothetical protein
MEEEDGHVVQLGTGRVVIWYGSQIAVSWKRKAFWLVQVAGWERGVIHKFSGKGKQIEWLILKGLRLTNLMANAVGATYWMNSKNYPRGQIVTLLPLLHFF